MKVQASLHSHQNLVLSVCLILAILVGVCWYLTEMLIFVSLMTNDVEQSFTCLLVISESSSVKSLFLSFAPLVTGFFLFFFFEILFIKEKEKAHV